MDLCILRCSKFLQTPRRLLLILPAPPPASASTRRVISQSHCVSVTSSITITGAAATEEEVEENPTNLSSKTESSSSLADFLVEQCGFTKPQLTKMTKSDELLHCRSPGAAQELVQIFMDFGFTPDEVRTVLLRQPTIMRCRADTVVKPKLELLRALDLPEKVFKNVISYSPRFLLNRLETLQEVLNFLRQSAGIQGTSLLRLLTFRPMILRTSKQTLQTQIDYVKSSMGIPPDSKAFVYGLVAVNHTSLQAFHKKFRILQSVGLQQHEIQDMVRKDPLIMIVSVEKINRVIDFLLHTAGLPATTVITYPALFKASIENKLRPRYLLYVSLKRILGPEFSPNLPSLLSMTRKRFITCYIKRYPASLQELSKHGYIMQGSSFKKIASLSKF